MVIKGIYDAELCYDEAQETKVRKRGTVIIFPGGGYEHLSERESTPIVRALNEGGYRGVILHYDVKSEILGLRPLKQAAWAVVTVKRLFPEEPVYLMGFSAGAHCAASYGVHFDDTDWYGKPFLPEVIQYLREHDAAKQETGNADEADIFLKETEGLEEHAGVSGLFRVDAMILAYPVISGGEWAHRGSFRRLLGKRETYVERYGDATDYDRALQWFSLEKHVHASTCPCFIWQTEPDEAVPIQNSLMFVESCIKQGVEVEYHIFPRGVHGMSLATKEVEDLGKNRITDPHIASWFPMMLRWLDEIIA